MGRACKSRYCSAAAFAWSCFPDYRHDPSADLHVYGMKHVGFAVKNVRAAIAELKAKGVEVALGPIENKTTVFAFIRDNSGIPLELIQHKQ